MTAPRISSRFSCARSWHSPSFLGVDHPRLPTKSSPMKAVTSHAWIGGFAVRLMQLRPGLHAGPAIHLAVQNHEAARTMQPQMAAEEFATRQVGTIDRIIASSPAIASGRRSSAQQG
jgi:hypothetical protein